MISFTKSLVLGVASIMLIISISSCGEKAAAKPNEPLSDGSVDLTDKVPVKKSLSAEFKSYWYAGEAEITSYKLQQARYGELRDGEAVLIFVTEPFLPDEQVKANGNGSSNVSVLKLNSTKNYLTGIYPYSIMSSTFYPVYDNQHAIKVSSSIQEWCGHVYAQLNNREKFEFTSHSYFEGEADQQNTLDKQVLENELWNRIRINPDNLPKGNTLIIPSLEFIRMAHKPMRAYDAITTLEKANDLSTYNISYPELNRSLSITFRTQFPHSIESWTETFTSGYGPKAKTLTSTATKMKVLKTPYWRQNGVGDEVLREDLGIR